MWICINMQKIRLFHWFNLEIWLIKKSWTLIGWKHFGPYLRSQNFFKYGISAGTQQIIQIFIITQIQLKLMTIFLINSKDSVFGTFLMYFPNFGGKNFFSGTTGSLMHNFKWISITMPKLKIMIKFEENA